MKKALYHPWQAYKILLTVFKQEKIMKAKPTLLATKTSQKVLSLILTTKSAATVAMLLLLNYESQK